MDKIAELVYDIGHYYVRYVLRDEQMTITKLL